MKLFPAVTFDVPGEDASPLPPEVIAGDQAPDFILPPVVWAIVLLVGGYLGLRYLME